MNERSYVYAKKPEYLSPTSLVALESNPLDFYLTRCAPEDVRPPRTPQNLAMAAGSAFDAFVKDAIDEELVRTGAQFARRVHASELLKKQVDEHIREQAAEVGFRLYKLYRRLGCVDRLLEEGLYEVDPECTNSEVPETSRELLGRRVAGVPIRGHLDAAKRDGDAQPVVHDWKVSGAQAKAGSIPSPKPGYFALYDSEQPLKSWESGHARHNDCLGSLDKGWGTQLTTYHWLLRPGTARGASFRPARVSVDMILVDSTLTRMKVACYRTKISPEFQESVRQRYINAWNLIQEEKLVPPGLQGHEPEVLRLLNTGGR